MASDVRQLLHQRRQAESAHSSDNERIEEAYQCLFNVSAEKAQPAAKSEVRMIPISKLRTFFTANIGFKPYPKEDLEAFAESIALNGLLERIQVRPIPGTDEFEILSGHNRTAAFKLLGREMIPAEIEYVDDDRAIVIATIPNLDHRQSLCPSERGWAYRSLLEAQKRQGRRTDLLPETSVEFQQKFSAREEVARIFKVKPHEVQRDIRLTYLIPVLLDAVDSRELRVSIGVSLSFYDVSSQQIFYKCWDDRKRICTPKVMNYIKKRCPAPTLQRRALEQCWHEALQAEESKNPQKLSLSFDRTELEPYLAKVGGEAELERQFVAFLKSL